MKVLKYCYLAVLTTLIAVTIAMAVATFFPQEVADKNVYSSVWFVAVWAVLAVSSLAVFAKKLAKRLPVMLFHISLIIILAGALVTRISGEEGMVHLREGESTDYYVKKENLYKENLGFELRLDSFKIVNYPGTQMPQDYVSYLTVGSETAEVSMNKILKKDGFRFYQTSYDPDGSGTYLSVNYDPYGIFLTYLGYMLFAISGLWIMFSKRAGFVNLLKHPSLKKGGLLALLIIIGVNADAQNRKLPTITYDESDQISAKQIVYNGRIAPFNTMARDFVLKIYGKPSYYSLTPEQVVCGWMYRPEVWKDEKMIYIKDESTRRQLGLDGKYAAFADFFDEQQNYKLDESKQPEAEKVGLILMLTSGKLFEETDVRISESKIKAEIIYNKVNFAKILFMLNLTLGFLAFLYIVFAGKYSETLFKILRGILIFSLTVDLCGYVLRWYISGRVPMGNGYETMLFMSLVITILAAVIKGKFIVAAGFVLSGFTLLVAYLGQANPQITPLMPVLNSPILSAHVSTIMAAYSLLAFTLLNGVSALIFKDKDKVEQLTVLSRLMLYPAEILLGIGIFLGSVWANISWGKYWSWDPKEVWALITFMVYAVPFHKADLKFLQNPKKFHLFTVLAFLTVLMTYFGVNYFLGGMHSYANS